MSNRAWSGRTTLVGITRASYPNIFDILRSSSRAVKKRSISERVLVRYKIAMHSSSDLVGRVDFFSRSVHDHTDLYSSNIRFQPYLVRLRSCIYRAETRLVELKSCKARVYVGIIERP